MGSTQIRKKFYLENIKGRNSFDDLFVNGRLMLKRVWHKQDWNCKIHTEVYSFHMRFFALNFWIYIRGYAHFSIIFTVISSVSITAMDTFTTISHVINMVNILPTALITMVATGYHGYSILVVALVSLPVLKLRVRHAVFSGCRQRKSIHSSGLRWHDIHTKICHNCSNSSSASCTMYTERVKYLF